MSIRLEGPCGVERAEELKQTLLDAIAAGEDGVDFSGVTDVDLTFFQLVHALRKQAEQGQAVPATTPTLPADFAAQAAWCGLEDIVDQTG